MVGGWWGWADFAQKVSLSIVGDRLTKKPFGDEKERRGILCEEALLGAL